MTINFQKQVSKKIRGFNQGAFRNKLARFSMKDKKFEELSDDNFTLTMVNPLVDDPDRVLMRYFEVKEQESVKAPSFYKVNLDTGSRELALKGNRQYGRYAFDKDGNPRFAAAQSSDNKETIHYYRKPGGTGWTEYARVNRDDFEQFSRVGLVEDNPNLIYVIAHNGNDKAGLWTYNLEQKKFEDLVYRRKDVDILNVGFHSNRWENFGVVTNVVYANDKVHRKFIDADEKAIVEQFEAAIPNAYQVNISSRSKDGNVIVVRNTGPKDPGSFYLYNDGDFSKLGSVNTLLKPSDLSNVEYISYSARDGKKITGYITKPKGPGPHPLVVMPHGGPFVTEVPVFDEWAQLFANNGYMVLQPQYRGSTKYGLDFYKSAFIDGGEGGGKMQDDKDDGAQYLVQKGLVDPDRMAMFGWSYGGYAALIAAARPNNIYQCAIAGAAVADNVQQVNYYRNEIRGSARVEQIKFWDESINPIKEASNVNIPLYLIHGSIDQRVPIKHSKKYLKELKKANKQPEYSELKDADHFSNTIKYDHKMDFYPKMIEFLQNDCGPDGL
jgi:dipeptidyl aminopeptidase/acylaminoacyl peptidase